MERPNPENALDIPPTIAPDAGPISKPAPRKGGSNGNGNGSNGNGHGNGNGNGHRAPMDALRELLTEAVTLPAAIESKPRLQYDCLKCPAYCCSYEKINVNKRDINRLARHFGIDPETAGKRFTKIVDGEAVLRHQKDEIYGTICMFIDKETRRCSVYEARPGVCHEYPDRPRCGYYEFLRWERRHQDDADFVPLRKG